MRRKRRLKRWVKVIISLILIIILVGGIFLIMNLQKKNKSTTDNVKEKTTTTSKEETPKKETLPKAPSTSEEASKLTDGEYETSNGKKLIRKSGLATVDGNLIVNKTYGLPSDYKPSNPYKQITTDWCPTCIDKDAMESFNLMQSDAKSLGLNIYISSGYRGYNSQKKLYDNYSAQDGKDAADTYSARPGYSEHQSGLCFDLNSVNDSFANTNEGKWVNENAYLYGFTIRFPKGRESETGYQYESWHLRYVGKELAKKLYNNGDWLSLEGYYGLSSKY